MTAVQREGRGAGTGREGGGGGFRGPNVTEVMSFLAAASLGFRVTVSKFRVIGVAPVSSLKRPAGDTQMDCEDQLG